MDLDKALRELYKEKKRLDRAIARVEARVEMMSGLPKRSTRGRKSMSEEERLRVSSRMTAYWASRRAKAQESLPSQPQGVELTPPEEPQNEAGKVSV